MNLTREALESLRRERGRRRGVLDALFPEQRKAVEDPSRRKAYCTTRRSGKTYAVLSDFLDDGMKNEACQYAYVALTRPSAEQISWPILKELDKKRPEPPETDDA